MFGIMLAIQARARRFSLATALVYTGVVLLLTLGHRCGYAAPEHHRAGLSSPGQHLIRATADKGSTAGRCLACTWQRDASSSLRLLPSPGAFQLRSHAVPALTAPRTLRGIRTQPASRGPPCA